MRTQPLLLSHPALYSGRLGSVSVTRPAPVPANPSTAVQPVDSLELSSEVQQLLELTPEEEQQVDELKQRDREVRTHEQAHLAAAGPHALGGPTYDFQNGPDGRSYAVGGEVQIDTSPVEGDPEATIRKAQTIRAASLSPAEPSAQDRAVAAAATQMEAHAQRELQTQSTGQANSWDYEIRQAYAPARVASRFAVQA